MMVEVTAVNSTGGNDAFAKSMKGKTVSKQTKQFFEQLKSGEQPTLIEGIKEAASFLKDIGGKIWDEAKPMVEHGNSEWAALMYTGQAYVMYPKTQQGAEQSQDQEQTKEVAEHQRDEREM